MQYKPITEEEWTELARARLYESAKSMLVDLYYRRGNGLSTLAHIFNVPMREIRIQLRRYDLPLREHEKGGEVPDSND